MDNSIPQAAQHILSFIYIGESAGNYDCVSNNIQKKLPKQVTKMTIAELLAQGPTWKAKYGALSSAAGAPQIINATLKTLVAQLGLKGTEKFDANMQDRMAYQLVRKRGYDQWANGQMDDATFALNLSKEWASLPVLISTKNYKGAAIHRGTSYYAGDGLNSAGHVSADKFEAVLAEAGGKPSASVVKSAPSKKKSAVQMAAVAAPVAVAAGACGDASQNITDWTPVISLAGQVATYGPYVAGAIVAAIAIVVIAKKVWK